jgi:hypothetical protein
MHDNSGIAAQKARVMRIPDICGTRSGAWASTKKKFVV